MALDKYTILNLDTAEDIVSLTGMKLNEILEIYRECVNFDQHAVYWQAGDRWFTLRVAGMYVTHGTIHKSVLDIMEHHSSMKLET